MSHTLYIGYARAECDKSLVRSTFEALLGLDYITNIYEKIKTNTRDKHKTFLITFMNEHVSGLKDIIDRITSEKFVKLTYKQDWNWKTRKYEERYWKVFIPYSPPAFKPRIMEADVSLKLEDEMPELEESIPNFGEYSYVRPYEENDSVHRANPAYLGKDMPFVGTSGRFWGLPDSTDDDDTAKDFEELEVAIAKFGEDYPGSIAPKIPKPPDEYDEEIVWQNFKKEEVSVLEEDEEWKELKAALDEFGAAGVYPYMSQSDLQAVCDEYDVEMPTSGGHRIREVTCPPGLNRETTMQQQDLDFYFLRTRAITPN
jgi:hypothetical protein